MSGILNIRDPNTGKFTPVTAIAGVGVPAKGTTGQILAKTSDADYDTQWKENDASKLGGKAPEEYATAEEVSQLKGEMVTQPSGEETPGEAPEINAGTFGGMTVAQFVDMIYPIGSIYMSASATSPATLFGGTWESIGGRFLLGADDTYAAGSTGGEASHTLTINELPSHEHWGAKGQLTTNTDAPVMDAHTLYSAKESIESGRYWYARTTTAGGGTAHNNMPPYLAVYMWVRVS